MGDADIYILLYHCMDFAVRTYKVHQRNETRAKNCLSVSHPRLSNEFGLSISSSTSLRFTLIPMIRHAEYDI